MKKNLMLTGLFLSVILVLGIVPFVSAEGITGEITITGAYKQCSTSADCESGSTCSYAGCGDNPGPCCSGGKVAPPDSYLDSTKTGTSSSSSAKKSSKSSCPKGWETAEKAGGGECCTSPSKRARATAGIIGLFIKK